MRESLKEYNRRMMREWRARKRQDPEWLAAHRKKECARVCAYYAAHPDKRREQWAKFVAKSGMLFLLKYLFLPFSDKSTRLSAHSRRNRGFLQNHCETAVTHSHTEIVSHHCHLLISFASLCLPSLFDRRDVLTTYLSV